MPETERVCKSDKGPFGEPNRLCSIALNPIPETLPTINFNILHNLIQASQMSYREGKEASLSLAKEFLTRSLGVAPVNVSSLSLRGVQYGGYPDYTIRISGKDGLLAGQRFFSGNFVIDNKDGSNTTHTFLVPTDRLTPKSQIPFFIDGVKVTPLEAGNSRFLSVLGSRASLGFVESKAPSPIVKLPTQSIFAKYVINEGTSILGAVNLEVSKNGLKATWVTKEGTDNALIAFSNLTQVGDGRCYHNFRVSEKAQLTATLNRNVDGSLYIESVVFKELNSKASLPVNIPIQISGAYNASSFKPGDKYYTFDLKTGVITSSLAK